jgi:hypothetical protein
VFCVTFKDTKRAITGQFRGLSAVSGGYNERFTQSRKGRKERKNYETDFG